MQFVQVFNLDFLMSTVVQGLWPLDWRSFAANDALQPLNVVVSGLFSMDAHTLTSSKGHFASLGELSRCMRASMVRQLYLVRPRLLRIECAARDFRYLVA